MKAKVTDILNLLSTLTARRAVNAIRVISGYYFSKLTKKPFQWGLPLSIAIEPTTACNLGCPECPSGLKKFSRETGNLKKDFFKQVIDELAGNVFYLTFYFQGEPYIHPEFLEMVRYARQKNIYTATSTNAHFLNDDNARKTVESGLDRLIISIDGTTRETYQSYRVNGKLEKVIEGTKNIIRWKKKLRSKKPYIIFQFLVVRQNEHQTEEVKKLAAELGVDTVKFKTAQIYDYQNGSDLMPSIEKYSRYKKLPGGKYAIKNEMLNHCWRMWHSCVITWDGLVVPCCFDKDATHRFGDLKKQSLAEVWNNGKYTSFRKSLLKARKEIDICTNCTEGTKVWA